MCLSRLLFASFLLIVCEVICFFMHLFLLLIFVVLLVSFCCRFVSRFCYFSDYGCLGGGGGTGSGALAVVLVPGQDFCRVFVNFVCVHLEFYIFLVSSFPSSLPFPLLSISDHAPGFSFRFGCFTRDC